MEWGSADDGRRDGDDTMTGARFDIATLQNAGVEFVQVLDDGDGGLQYVQPVLA